MNRKSILNLLYNKKLCEKSCSTRFPWGWKPKNIIKEEEEIIIKSNNEPFYHNYHTFESNHFLEHSRIGYNIIYKNYIDKVDFLDRQYTTPSLSIALNKLRSQSDEDKLKKFPDDIETIENYILSNKIEYKPTTSNFKILGFTSKKEIKYNLFMGLSNPDETDLRTQHPTKQIINVLYLSDNFYDILEWERDLLEITPEWQVSNINNVLFNNLSPNLKI